MRPEDLGYSMEWESFRKAFIPDDFVLGRVVAEHKERYIVRTPGEEYEAEITGNLRFTARDKEDFPVVGDWVALVPCDQERAIIHRILPRFSLLKRKGVGEASEIQPIAANVDTALIIQAVDRDFNINRIERYLAICFSARVNPLIVLTKTDLVNRVQLEEMLGMVRARIPQVPVLSVSNETQNGYSELKALLEKGKTYCMLGSSGAGKSTLLNNLSGRLVMKTEAISISTNKGKHVTTHRELVILEEGAIFIDNPGMREVGISSDSDGLEGAFSRIVVLSGNCRYKDCTHTSEAGCGVLQALDSGELDRSSYENYLKMEKERIHFEETVLEKRRREKLFGKMIRNYKKVMQGRD